MIIDVSEIRKSPWQKFHYDFKEEIKPLDMESDEICFKGLVEVSVDITNTGRILLFKGSIKGDPELLCSRCLEKYTFHLETDFEEKFCHVSEVSQAAEEGGDPEDLQVFENNRIRLDDLIWETINLGIPMKSVCREECKGLCGLCGTNLNLKECQCKTENIDPRLEGLKKFYDR
ncbi:MAG: hypothetical protein CVU89_03605 [Firmicutes bacterium HGW-Firmicutes-14]|nr:MAG: hypothetical protein CVU89_03605 [Firmicutes bacterium HGW-Firmicutes-14]